MISVLVIGRSGQLARALAESSAAARGAAAAGGLTTQQVARRACEPKDALRDESELSLSFLSRPEIDLESPEGLAERIAESSPQVVINAAAFTDVDAAEIESGKAHRINALAAEEIARGARLRDAVSIQVSTDYVFDGSGSAPKKEGDPTAPLCEYGRSKLEGERLVAQANPKHLIARTAWLYSPWGRNFVSTMLRLGRERKSLDVVDDQFGNPTCALDLAEALLEMARRSAWASFADWGACHVAGNGTASWFEFAQAVFESARREGQESIPSLNPVSSADWLARAGADRAEARQAEADRAEAQRVGASRPLNSRLDCSKLRESFGLSLPDWKLSVARTVHRILSASPESGSSS